MLARLQAQSHWAALAVAALLLGGLFVRNFWVLGDIYMLSRVAEQFLAGNGPTWNTDERVWLSTSVAWQWMVIALRAVWGADPYVHALALHSACLLALLAVLYWHWRNGWLVLLTALLMAGSNSLIDYASGGLENGLGYVVIAAFWAVAMRGGNPRWLTPLFGLALLLRYDMTILLAPALAWAYWSFYERAILARWREWLPAALLSMLPVVAWLAFTQFYYGTIMPASFYAKKGDFFDYGLAYLANTSLYDSWVLLLGLAGTGLAFWKGAAIERLLAAGAVCYMAYILLVGGVDAGLGRLLTPSFMLATLLLTGRVCPLLATFRQQLLGCAAAAMMLVMFGMSVHTPLFPVYDFWNDESYPQGAINAHRDNRFWAPNAALPLAVPNGWRPMPEELRLTIMENAQASLERGEAYTPVKHGWHSSYYLPLDVVLIDWWHRHWRPGDFAPDWPVDTTR